MTRELVHYRQLERRLWITRWRHEGEESAEEDAILDEMERSWMSLGQDERSLISQEGPRCWPLDSASRPPDLADTAPASAPKPWSYEGFRSPGDAILSEDAA